MCPTVIAKPEITDSVRIVFIPGFGPSQKRFAAQFEQDGLGYLYRKNFKEAPIRVSAEERDVFVKSFDLKLLCCFFLTIIGTVAILVWIASHAFSTGEAVSQVQMFAGAGLVIGIILALSSWAWNAPARALRERGASGVALTKLEFERSHFAKLSWANFAVSAGLLIVVFLKFVAGRDMLAGWNPVWLALLILAAAILGFQAYRKWRYERSDKG